jgi:hypothetical protein
MEILDNFGGDFHINSTKSDNFILGLVSVYEAAQDAFKPAFLREMVNLAKEFVGVVRRSKVT